MPQPNDWFLAAVVGWHGRNVHSLAGAHIEARLVGPTTGRNKNTVVLQLASASRLVSVEVWDSGECEVISSAVAGPENVPTVTLSHLDGPDAVVEVLDDVVIGFGPR